MNKEFSYGSYTFNIKVELNFEVERRPNGRRWHKVTVNDIGEGSYHQVTKFEEMYLIKGIEVMEQSAKNWVDQKEGNTPQSTIEQQLIAIGFK